MPRIPLLPPSALDAEQRTLYDAITGGPRGSGPQHFALTHPDGSLTGPFNALLQSPSVGAALQEVGAALRYRTSLSDRAREIAILLVAARWDSAFERSAHEPVGRAAGLTDDEILALGDQRVDGLPDDERVVGRTVTALLDGDLTDEEWDAAAAALGTPVVFELTTLVGYYSTLALQLRVFRV
ncbi:carboxymuconolactone decarboxylase family protein [Microbacterium sp. AZCO]|uniref:carboxymuconolactone decarboxylase family protein n=1 Tax=Microbacterium sp. AZCO TaxID=3142976 RepID=UPI0031F3CACA